MKFGEQKADFIFAPLFFIIMLMNGFLIGVLEDLSIKDELTTAGFGIYGVIVVELFGAIFGFVAWVVWRANI